MTIKENSRGIQHIGIPTGDMEKTVAFYEKIGFEKAFALKNERSNVCFMKLDNLVIEFYAVAEPKMCAGAVDHICIDVKDIDAAFEEIKSMGMEFDGGEEIHELPFWDNGVRFFKIVGPNKELIEFGQYL